MLFNFHTYHIDEVFCLLNVDMDKRLDDYPHQVKLSVGIHPWKVNDGWEKTFENVSNVARKDEVWAIGECGLDKVRGEAFSRQMEAFKAHIHLSESVEKPLIIHCVKAVDEVLALRHALNLRCKKTAKEPQPWVIHGFRGKPKQAKQLMTKGLLLSFGHQYNIETLREVFTSCRPFFLETDDLPLSVRQIYAQVAHHLDVDVGRIEHLCDPLQTIFRQRAF